MSQEDRNLMLPNPQETDPLSSDELGATATEIGENYANMHITRPDLVQRRREIRRGPETKLA